MEPNQAKYHLDRLEKCELVTSRREEGFLLYFPKAEGSFGLREAVAAPEKAVLALLRRPVPLQVTLALLEHDEATHTQLTDLVPVAHGTLHYHLQRMEAKGLLTSEKVGRERRYRLVERDRIESLLLRYRPPDKLVQGFLEAWEAFET